MSTINSKQRRFINEYLIDLNATQSAIRAGYSAKTARQIGQRLLTNVDIKREIDACLARMHDRQRKSLIIAADKAIAALIDVTETGSSAARVSAANSILERAAHKSSDTLHTEFMELLIKDSGLSEKIRHSQAIENLLREVAKSTNIQQEPY